MSLENGLFIFRRDLRIIDNNGLNYLSSICKNVYTIFIFTPEQVGSGNKYKSNNAIEFMIESLDNLATDIRKEGGHLYTFYGHNDKVIVDCIAAWDINIVAFNLDITPFARIRDDKIVKLCQKMNVFVTYDNDYFLHAPGSILNGSGDPYQIFTPYYNRARQIKVQKPVGKRSLPLKKSDKQIPNKISLELAFKKFVGKENPDILVRGGRDNAIKQMHIAAKNIRNYAQTRDELSKPTSQLSAYIKFGCVSIREVHNAFSSKTEFVRQLYWRDFYSNVLYFFPRVIGHNFKEKYDRIKWHNNEHWFKAWCEGKTGIPIVDASQRQLLKVGYVHNRARMISSSILTKIMLIDWRKGEQFYSQHLVDIDIANNNGGWQSSAGGGSNADPYFRYFNPYRQSELHDKNCEYIKTWIPELKDVPVKDIHNWETEWEKHKDCGYPKPIVNFAEQREKSLKLYKSSLY